VLLQCGTNNYRAAEALLPLDASVFHERFTEDCPLFYAAGSKHGTDTRLLNLILDRGGDIHSVYNHACGPLTLLASWGGRPATERLDSLVDHGGG
jgi:hypothetical protein